MIFISSRALVDNYSKEELEKIVTNSFSMAEVIEKLGYKTRNGSNFKTILKRIKEYNINCDHFRVPERVVRTFENTFCKDSTASQNTLRSAFIKISDNTFCKICGQSNIWNDKELTMILDHIDGNNHNNVINNLRWICPNCNSQLPTFAGRNLKERKSQIDGKIKYVPMIKRKKNMKICPICNINEISMNSKMCLECYNKDRRKNIPPKEELEKLIYIKSFVEISKKYNVTDNAVRKWCKSYGLPFRYGELHKYGA